MVTDTDIDPSLLQQSASIRETPAKHMLDDRDLNALKKKKQKSEFSMSGSDTVRLLINEFSRIAPVLSDNDKYKLMGRKVACLSDPFRSPRMAFCVGFGTACDDDVDPEMY